MKTEDLQLSDVFLKALNHLPLEYNFALYSRIFDDFGTHYFTSGSLGGVYDLLYQFSLEELRNSGRLFAALFFFFSTRFYCLQFTFLLLFHFNSSLSTFRLRFFPK